MTWEMVRFQGLETCPCGKVAFDSREEAERFAELRGWSDLVAYGCLGAWHLGRPPRRARSQRRRRGRRVRNRGRIVR